MVDPRHLASAAVDAGLALARLALTAAPTAARAVFRLVRRPARESGPPDEPAIKVDAPVPPRRPRREPKPRRSRARRTPDLEAAAAAVVDPHIDEDEPELVASVAEAGAEDGAGPELDVAEPWEGYRQMTAPALLERLEQATAEEAAAIQLYESFHGKRRRVLDAASRRLETTARS